MGKTAGGSEGLRNSRDMVVMGGRCVNGGWYSMGGPALREARGSCQSLLRDARSSWFLGEGTTEM